MYEPGLLGSTGQLLLVGFFVGIVACALYAWYESWKDR